MEGRKIVIKKRGDINYYDGLILDYLLLGLRIHIVNTKHESACKGNQSIFQNEDPDIRVILISKNLKNKFKIMEKTYYTESRKSYRPCPTDPLDTFNWECPVCGQGFE